jgi:competence protein ComEC
MRRLLALLAFSVALAAQKPQATLDFYFIDVEGGSSVLIVTPAGESLLVDTGYDGHGDRDAKRIQSAVARAGLTRIDHLLITHFHHDHLGGIKALAKLVPIEHFYDHGEQPVSKEDKINSDEYEAYRKAAKGKAVALKPADLIPLKGARVQVVSSNGQTVIGKGAAENPLCREAEPHSDEPGENPRSVGILITLGKFRFLNLGDLTWNVEQRLACPANLIGQIDLLQVSHHGKNTSSNLTLLKTIHPRVAVMTNGPTSGGHPDVMRRLRAAGVADVFQVHRSEAPNEADKIANLGGEDDCPGNIIKASAAADGSFTVD